ncbi:MAG: hypothetical protein EOP04_31615 [Proteobacteria bacterium]|nr:MAG: hypothetical protein EOP04_31615 [Pseudomonadota bacterium]
MESNIGGKRNPASISIAVNEESGRILAINVAWMPLKGRLVEKMNREGIPFPEYQDQRPSAYDASFKAINSQAMGYPITVVTDGYPSYPGYVKRNVEKNPIHQVSLRNASADHDPMFWLNHVCARIRADLSRMGRKTWCVSRSIEALQHHLNIFMEFFNSRMYQTKG